jgi:hypothetical protein
MATLLIEVSRTGVGEIRAAACTISDSIEARRLIEASAVGLRLLDSSILEYFEGRATPDAVDVADEPGVWVKTDRDGFLDRPRKIKVRVGTLPRDPFEAPPAWFVEGCKKLFPDQSNAEGVVSPDWDNAEAPLSKEMLLALHSKEYIEKHKHLSEEELNELSDPPFCTRTEELAVSLFVSACSSSSWLDHWGWVGECNENDLLVSEPYRVNRDHLKNLEVLCDKVGWTFSIQGVSGHYPSATIRIVINPSEKGFCYVR